MLGSSLTTWKIPWMLRYLPCFRVYELEDIKKRSEETIDALVDHKCQLACHALIGDSSDTAVEFKVQCRLICAIPDGDIELAEGTSQGQL